jgi:hypothetical protein
MISTCTSCIIPSPNSKKRILKSCRGYLKDVGKIHRLEFILRDDVLPTNVDDIPMDDEPNVAPVLKSLHFTDVDWYFFCTVDLSFTNMLA